VLDLIYAERVEALGHRGVVVIETAVGEWLRHSRVGLDRVMLLDPLDGFLDARVVLGDAAVNQALDAGVGHAAVAGQRAVGVRPIPLVFAAVGRGVHEAAVVDLAGPRLVVLFALEVLATAHEDQGLLERRIVLGYAGGV